MKERWEGRKVDRERVVIGDKGREVRGRKGERSEQVQELGIQTFHGPV